MKKGFTLIELLVVIAIIAILAAILFPVFAKAREKARQTTCLNNSKQISVAVLMFVQDHDETFPDATTWTTALASDYGVTGKVWDCPTSSFKGTEAAPDYFYVGGSFLANRALGDIKDPVAAPMVADLASPKSNKPYVDDGGVNDLSIAAAKVDTRHNNGAMFAFVDGHVTWLTAKSITPIMFLPSVDLNEFNMPVYLGLATEKPVAGGDGVSLRAALEPLGITAGIGRAYNWTSGAPTLGIDVTSPTTSSGYYTMNAGTGEINAFGGGVANLPTWWKTGAGGTKFVNLQSNGNAGWVWGATNYSGMVMDNGGTATTITITLVHNLTVADTRIFAVISGSGWNGAASSVTVNYFTVGANTYNNGGAGWKIDKPAGVGSSAIAGLFLVPCQPGKNIEFKLSQPGGSNVGTFLAFPAK